MTGCMVSSSLSIAPALHIARRADFVDLDGPIWLAEDRPGGVRDAVRLSVAAGTRILGNDMKMRRFACSAGIAALALGAAPRRRSRSTC